MTQKFFTTSAGFGPATHAAGQTHSTRQKNLFSRRRRAPLRRGNPGTSKPAANRTHHPE